MNYSRRPNRPDANYYRETRRRSMAAKAFGSTGQRRRRGPGMLVFWLLLLVVACAGAVWWVWFRK
jgi:hypothetical protein